MIEELDKRIKFVSEDSAQRERGVILFYRLVLALLLTQKDVFADLSARDRLARAHQEILKNLPKSDDYLGQNRGFEEEIDFFFRWVDQVEGFGLSEVEVEPE